MAEAVEHIKPLYFEDPLSPIYSDSWLALPMIIERLRTGAARLHGAGEPVA